MSVLDLIIFACGSGRMREREGEYHSSHEVASYHV
jgi:hypothetical protein